MTTSDSRPTDERRPPADDELEFAPEEQAYTPPVRDAHDEDPVRGEVVDDPDDPTPPDVAPPAGHPDTGMDTELPPVEDTRPDVPRTMDGEETDFEPLRVPVMHGDGSEDSAVSTPEAAGVGSAAGVAGAGGGDRWQAIQVRFVDDPTGAVDEAAALVEEAITTLRQGYESGDATGDSTEKLRRALRRYRSVHQAVTSAED